MSAIYGYNVYCLQEYPRYPIYCSTYEEVEKVVKGDDDNYVVKVRTDPEDDYVWCDDDI